MAALSTRRESSRAGFEFKLEIVANRDGVDILGPLRSSKRRRRNFYAHQPVRHSGKIRVLYTSSVRSLTRRLALPGLVTAIALLPSGHISHGIPQIGWNGSALCLDVPVSSLIIHPTRCWMSGPTSIVVAGTDARSGKSAEMVVGKVQRRPVQELVSHARSGPLRSSKLASSAAGDPAATSSFYVYGSDIDVGGLSATTECPLYDDAANETVPPTGGMTILDFGAPCFEPATLPLGTQLFNSHCSTPDNTIVILSQTWLPGSVS